MGLVNCNIQNDDSGAWLNALKVVEQSYRTGEPDFGFWKSRLGYRGRANPVRVAVRKDFYRQLNTT